MLPGLKSMLNYHPLFVHFPIALWFAALLYEALAIWRANDEWHRTAIRLLYLGTLGACAAAFTGWLAESSVPDTGAVHSAFEIHELLMLITTSFAAALCLLCFSMRARFTSGMRRLLLAGLVVLAILTTVGADRGAQLVYKFATSVNLPDAPK
jgi:uncharacterized membrane protein